MWTLVLWILLFIGGFVIIYFSADVFIDNLKDFCLVYGLSAFFVGSLIIGIDPEESVASITAGAYGLPYIAIGNVIGNSIIALTLCFALPALFYRFKFKKISNFYFLIIYASLLIILLGIFIPVYGLLIAGISAIILYSIYFIRNIQYSKIIEPEENVFSSVKDEDEESDERGKEKSKRKMIALIILSFVIIVLGGQLMVWATEKIMNEITIMTGISTSIIESIFGFVIIAFVTNVEEITLMIKSIQKHSVEIGVGGMIGKLVWNLTLTFGISGVLLIDMTFIRPLLWNTIVLFVVLTIFYLIARKGSMGKKDGIILAGFFVIFLIVNFI